VLSTHFSEQSEKLEALCRRFGVRSLELFGSAAMGTDSSGAGDLDFLVEFRPDPPGGYAEAYFGLLESLTELFGRRVDLVVTAAIRNPYFLEAIQRTRTLLYAA